MKLFLILFLILSVFPVWAEENPSLPLCDVGLPVLIQVENMPRGADMYYEGRHEMEVLEAERSCKFLSPGYAEEIKKSDAWTTLKINIYSAGVKNDDDELVVFGKFLSMSPTHRPKLLSLNPWYSGQTVCVNALEKPLGKSPLRQLVNLTIYGPAKCPEGETLLRDRFYCYQLSE